MPDCRFETISARVDRFTPDERTDRPTLGAIRGTAGTLIVAAAGKPLLVKGSMVKPGACVIDVGINRLPDGKLCGDVEAQSVSPIAGWLSPVPGGVGPMTITMLLANTLNAAEQQAG